MSGVMPKMANSGFSGDWYDHPLYAGYWQHYNQAMGWYRKHQRAYKKAMLAAYGPMTFPAHQTNIPTHSGWPMGGSGQTGHEDRDRSGSEKDDDSSEESESGIECDVTNMEISQELRDYFAQTARHKEELKRQQEEEAARHDEYVLADQDLRVAAAGWRTITAPQERPGERRSAEMKRLYGENAARIQAMETAMQLNFDRNQDRIQPKYWPVIPLRL